MHKEAFTQRSFYAENLLHRKPFTQSSLFNFQLQNQISTPKRKKRDFKALFKTTFKGRSYWPKKSAAKTPFTTFTQPLQYDLRRCAAQDNSITHAVAAAQPFHCDLSRPIGKMQKNYARRLHKLRLQNEESRRPSGKTTILKHFLKEFEKENHQRQHEEKYVAKAPFATFTRPLQ